MAGGEGGGGRHTEFHPIPPSDDVRHMINDLHPSPPPPPESVIYFVNDPLPSWADHFYFVP